MIKFRAIKGERRILAFGISRENVQRLTAGDPIHVWLDDMGIPATDLLIFFGETEQAMVEDLKANGVQVDKIRVDPKLQ